MKHKRFLLSLLLLLILQTTACGLSPQPTNIPTHTNTPAPANTLEPIVHVEPEPNPVWHPHKVTLMGPLEMSIPGRNATAGQGWLELTIRQDGEAIVFLRYSLLRANCYSDSGKILKENYGWTLSAALPGPAFIVDGMFEFDSWNGLKVVSGQVTSPTAANALVEISTEDWSASEGSFMCDFGTWAWSGEEK